MTSKRSSSITATTTGDATNAVSDNVTSWATNLLGAVALSLVFPGKYGRGGSGAR
jgi:hypothetical protein